MKLNNMSDEELDRLFRETAESFDPPFDPEAWKAMDQKLDKTEAPNRFFTISSLVLLISLLFCITTLTTLLYEPKTGIQVSPSPVKEKTITNHPTSIAGGSTTQSKSGIAIENQENKSEQVNQPLNKEEAASGRKPRGRVDVLPSSQVRRRGIHPFLASFSENKPKTARQHHTEKGATDVQLTTSDTFKSRPILPEIQSVKDSVGQAELVNTPLADSVLQGADSLVQKPVIAIADEKALQLKGDSTVQEASTQTASQRPFLNYVQVALAIAPDLTTANFKHPDGVSVNAGLLLAVPLTRRLSLVSGVLWANKVYSASGKDYAYSGGSYAVSDEIYATCKVLDIPLNLKFQLLDWGKNALALQAGVSSYIMLSEEYSSAYDYYAYTGAGTVTNTWEVKNKNRHWFSVQNLSLQYTRSLSPAFSIGVEPFVKVPYEGIGEGKIKLTSAGIFFSTGYKLNLK